MNEVEVEQELLWGKMRKKCLEWRKTVWRSGFLKGVYPMDPFPRTVLFVTILFPQQLLVKDFRELRSVVEQMGLLKPSNLFFFLIFLHIVLLDVAAWLTIWYFGTSVGSFFLSVLLFTSAQVQCWNHYAVLEICLFFSVLMISEIPEVSWIWTTVWILLRLWP